MSNENFWCGYLEAGERSSGVLIDSRLNTGDPATVYVFNLQRGQILEYRRAIVEGKLRELGDDESKLASELKTAYRKVRSNFVPRGAKISSIPEKGQTSAGKPVTSPELAVDEYDVDEDDYLDDADTDEDDADEE